MKLLNNIIILCLFVTFNEAAHNCTSFNDKNHGYGCEMRNIEPQTEDSEINVMSRDANKSEADVVWVQIRDSKIGNLPKGVFEKFKNMERIMIIASTGLANLNVSYFDKNIKLVLMKNTDLENVGENAFTQLDVLQTLSLNYNKVKKIHKLAFRDLVRVEKIEMVFNQIETLDDELFVSNVNLKLVLLYNNKIKVISQNLFGRNTKLESLQLQNNAISQIERGFNTPLKAMTRMDISSNICINENIAITRYVQWSSHQYKFKDCYNNYALIKSTNDDIKAVNSKLDDLETEVANTIEKVNNDMSILEGKMENSTALDEVKTNLVDFFKKDRETLVKSFDDDLTKITSHVKTDMIEEIEKKLKEKVIPQQEKLVSDDFGKLRSEFKSDMRTIYILFFALICFAIATTFFVFHKLNIIQIPRQVYSGYSTRNERQLIDPEN